MNQLLPKKMTATAAIYVHVKQVQVDYSKQRVVEKEFQKHTVLLILIAV